MIKQSIFPLKIEKILLEKNICAEDLLEILQNFWVEDIEPFIHWIESELSLFLLNYEKINHKEAFADVFRLLSSYKEFSPSMPTASFKFALRKRYGRFEQLKTICNFLSLHGVKQPIEYIITNDIETYLFDRVNTTYLCIEKIQFMESIPRLKECVDHSNMYDLINFVWYADIKWTYFSLVEIWYEHVLGQNIYILTRWSKIKEYINILQIMWYKSQEDFLKFLDTEFSYTVKCEGEIIYRHKKWIQMMYDLNIKQFEKKLKEAHQSK